MDKNNNTDAKKHHRHRRVHRMPDGMQTVHQDYGLWILLAKQQAYPADSYRNFPKRYFEYFSISHLTEGGGRLWISGEGEHDVHAGQCIIIPPYTLNRYGGSDGKPYIEDSICFAGPIAEQMLQAGIIRAGVFDLGLARLLLPIQHMAENPANASQINANIALQKLLMDIHNESKALGHAGDSPEAVVETLLAALREQLNHWWTVAEMAEFCGMGKEQFRRAFKKHTGLLPKHYLEQLKLRKAARLLIGIDAKASEVAEQLGYHDYYHFSRRFKIVMGLSPQQYREHFGSKH